MEVIKTRGRRRRAGNDRKVRKTRRVSRRGQSVQVESSDPTCRSPGASQDVSAGSVYARRDGGKRKTKRAARSSVWRVKPETSGRRGKAPKIRESRTIRTFNRRLADDKGWMNV